MEPHRTDPPPRRGIGCLLLLMALLAGLGFVGMAVAGLGGLGGAASPIQEIVEKVEPGASKKLVIIDVRGVLVRAGGMAGGVTEATLAMLERAAEDDSVAGVLLAVDTPGGSVTDADLIHHAIRRLRDKKRRVLVHMGDLCASGGYYLAVAADEIWALPTTVTGSIGVIINNIELGGLLDRFGVRDDSITSGQNKQMLSPFEPLTDEQRALLQGIVDSMYARFLDVIVKGRGIEIEALRPIADGRLLTAEQAREAGLVDRIDYPKAALARLGALAGEGPFTVVRYRSEPGLFDLFRARLGASERPLVAELLQGPRAMYLHGPPALVR